MDLNVERLEDTSVRDEDKCVCLMLGSGDHSPAACGPVNRISGWNVRTYLALRNCIGCLLLAETVTYI